ncbi:MAG: hypothetical protein ACXVB9_10845 [Bdellovibrionota bacterium]
MKMTNLLATMFLITSVSAFADDSVPNVPVAGENGAVKQQLSQDKAVVNADKSKLMVDKKKLHEDRKAARIARKGKVRKHNKKQPDGGQPVQPEQPKST